VVEVETIIVLPIHRFPTEKVGMLGCWGAELLIIEVTFIGIAVTVEPEQPDDDKRGIEHETVPDVEVQ
jgi:hypothetical protein